MEVLVSNERPIVLLTMGDPAGVGPLITVKALAKPSELKNHCRVVVIGHKATLEAAARAARIDFRPLLLPSPPWDNWDKMPEIREGTVAVAEPGELGLKAAEPAIPTLEGGKAQLAFIDAAIAALNAGQAQRLVTGPVSKIAISRTGIPFTGHTEYLAQAAKLRSDAVTMMFAGPTLRVALVTTHLPLKKVAESLNISRVSATIGRVIGALRDQWQIERPKVVVLALNPHAGEEGLLGDEESSVLMPAVLAAKQSNPQAAITGPVPSEVGLRGTVADRYDAAVALYHDQATIACKLLDMGRSVNVTLGLPFVRTSVDHGVAYDAAAAGDAHSDSLEAALDLAATLSSPDVASALAQE